jgi:hypothetical protein
MTYQDSKNNTLYAVLLPEIDLDVVGTERRSYQTGCNYLAVPKHVPKNLLTTLPLHFAQPPKLNRDAAFQNCTQIATIVLHGMQFTESALALPS